MRKVYEMKSFKVCGLALILSWLLLWTWAAGAGSPAPVPPDVEVGGALIAGDAVAAPARLATNSAPFGAESNPTGNPIGGGAGYSDILAPSQADYTVTTKSELLFALEDVQAYARDSWGAMNGFIRGAAWVTGKSGHALRFDGVDDHVEYVNPSGLKSPAGTLAFWLRRDGAISNTDVINIFEDGYQNYLLIRLNNDKLYVGIEDDNLEQVSLIASQPITDANYHHVAVTQDGAGIQIFVDGEQSAVTGANAADWTDHLTLAGMWIGGGHWSHFMGDIDEVTLYNRALTPAEIQQNYAGAAIVTAGLVSWQRFEENPALARKIIYIADDAAIDLTGEKNVPIPVSVTLASGRGRDGSAGGLIYTTQDYTHVTLLRATGPGVRLTGLRLQGPDPEIGDRNDVVATGITSGYPFFEVDNCELWGWSAAAVSADKGNTNAYIHHNWMHHNRRTGRGYGVVLGYSDATAPIEVLIEANLFDYCRHAIAATGNTYSSYEARYNLALEHANSHSFDRHGVGISGSWWGGDAGNRTLIYSNTARATSVRAVAIRGMPSISAEIANNWFYRDDQVSAILLYTTTHVWIGDNHYSAVPPSGTVLPVARPDAQPTYGRAPLTVSFDGARSYDPDGQIVAYRWDFGDGSVANGVQATHTFTAAGRYYVELSVSDDHGVPSKTGIPIVVAPASGRYVLDFWSKDSYRGALAGYYRKQVLIDGVVVWEDDVAGDEGWTHVMTDVSAYVEGKLEITLTLQTRCNQAVTDPHNEIVELLTYWDDVNLSGGHVLNGGMESPGDWRYSESSETWTGWAVSGDVRSGDRAYSLEYPYETNSTAGSWARIEQPVTIISSTLLGRWDFEQVAGGSTPDASSYGNHGIFVAMDDDPGVSGIIGQALQLDGVDDYVDAGSDASLTSPLGTISLWIKPQAVGEMDILRLFEDDEQAYLLLTLTGSGQIRALIADAGAPQVALTSTAAITAAGYHHVAITQAGSGVRIFLDGKESATTGVNSAYWSSHLAGGRLQLGRGHHGYFDGALDNAAIYTRALSADEIARRYDEGYPRGRWPLDEGYGDTTADTSANGHHGTLTNMSAGSWVNGVSGKALQFDGIDDYVDFGNRPGLALTDTMTIELWGKFDTFTLDETLLSNNLYRIFHRGDWAGDRLYFLYRIAENARVGDSAWDHWAGVRTETEWIPGQWYHLVCVKDGDRMSLYLNGALEKDFNGLSGYTVEDSQVGSLYLGQNPFNGAVDEITLYSRAMTSEEVYRRYAQGRFHTQVYLPLILR